MALRLGLLINPLAGIGGPLALKGSDGDEIVSKALSMGAECLSSQRAQVTLSQLKEFSDDIAWFTAPSIMGEDCLKQSGFKPVVIGQLTREKTTPEDTQRLAKKLVEQKIDLLLFVGGDGTARNLIDAIAYDVIGQQQLVLGIPAGVKMHSGVYAISPQAAARVVQEFLQKKPVSISLQEVRDIDESLLREGQVNSKYYGELMVPNDERYVQQVKNSGELDDSAMQAEIAAGIVDEMDNDTIYIVGAGTTPKAVMDELGLPNTLLGVDIILGRELIESDLSAVELLDTLATYPYHPVQLIMTATGGQGHVIGRGNQQLSSTLLKKIGKDHILLLLTPNKLAALNGRPLLMDSGDAELDRQWQGWIPIITGYQQQSTYPLYSGG
ncbi:MAG: ATP-NAD kinase family protein [Cellvibrionaceae bacterium]